ncbi:RCC1/BLIP-II protein, partial [Sistotremastrum suecicum HHB10207 ss-3]
MVTKTTKTKATKLPVPSDDEGRDGGGRKRVKKGKAEVGQETGDAPEVEAAEITETNGVEAAQPDATPAPPPAPAPAPTAPRKSLNPLPSLPTPPPPPDSTPPSSPPPQPQNPNPTPNPSIPFIWGNGDMGQFGLGPDITGDIRKPRLHAFFEEACEEGKLGMGGVRRVEAGGMHSLVIDDEGKVWSWGINDNASLGRVTSGVPDPEREGGIIDSEILETNPMVVQALLDEEPEFRAVDVCAGDSISVALDASGQLRAWGSFRASDGLLGFERQADSAKHCFTPVSLPTIAKETFSQVACGTDHVLALTTSGRIWVWGNGQQGQLGRRIIERRKVNGLHPERLALRKIKVIGTGSYHSFAVDWKGVVYGWGLNSFRQTGVEEADDVIWEPREVEALNPKRLGGRRVVQISGGEHHTLFLLDDGTVYSVGRSDGGEVGLGEDHPVMEEKKEREEEEKVEIAIKRAKEKQKRKEEREKAGEEPEDEIPDGPIQVNEYVATPTVVEFPSPGPVVAISAGTRHNLALMASGEVYSWGLGNSSQLGLGKDADGEDIELARTPQRVLSQKMNGWKVTGVSAGGQHCLLVG